MTLIFKTREKTEGVRLVYLSAKADITLEELNRLARRNGKFNLGYHYVIHKNGLIDKGIDDCLFADYELPYHTTSIYVAVIGDKLNDAQRYTLRNLLEKLQINLKED